MITKPNLTRDQIIQILENEYVKLSLFADNLTGYRRKEAKFCESVIGSILWRIEQGKMRLDDE